MKRILSSTFFILILTFCFSSLAFAEYINIPSGVAIKGGMDSEETIDTYQFTTNKDDGDVYITLDDITGGFSMSIYDERGGLIKGYSERNKGKAILDSRTLDKGTYFVKITLFDWSGITNASYRLKATYPSSFTHNNSTFEPNDTFETSLPIKSGEFYKSESDSEIDVDYQFTTNRGDGDVYITLDDLTGGYSMSIYDERGGFIKGYSERNKGKTILDSRTLAEGTYFVKITPFDWSGITSASYRLKATYPSSFIRNNSTFEPNDTFETSLPIKSGQFINQRAIANSMWILINSPLIEVMETFILRLMI